MGSNKSSREEIYIINNKGNNNINNKHSNLDRIQYLDNNLLSKLQLIAIVLIAITIIIS